MDNYVFTANDVNWVYSERTGAIPFIINEKQTKVKQIEDGVIITIPDKCQSENPFMAAVDTFSDYYNEQMDFVNSTSMFAYVNFYQNLKHFHCQFLCEKTPLNRDQIDFLKDNYNKKMAKVNREQAEKLAKIKKLEDEKHRVFDF